MVEIVFRGKELIPCFFFLTHVCILSHTLEQGTSNARGASKSVDGRITPSDRSEPEKAAPRTTGGQADH
jgi:hypothetical protein